MANRKTLDVHMALPRVVELFNAVGSKHKIQIEWS